MVLVPGSVATSAAVLVVTLNTSVAAISTALPMETLYSSIVATRTALPMVMPSL